MSDADRAVTWLLDCVQRDPNLRWQLLHTESFRLLCVAEAARTGETAEAVHARRAADLEPAGVRRPSRVRELEAQLDKLRRKHNDWE